MSRLGKAVLATLVIAPLVSSAFAPNAAAYDAENTHRWIAREAVELLAATYPGEYDELLEHIEDVVRGAHHEDDVYLDGDDDPGTLRVMRHFYHAVDETGLVFKGVQFPSSYEWNALDNEQNEWDYHDGLRAYQHGDFAEAYFIAGHTIHLIADLTVPAHTHLDEHGPPNGDNYEDHCTARMKNQYEGTLRAPAPDATIPVFLNLEDAFQKTSRASYYRNMYPGDFAGEQPSGVVFQMFPDVSRGWISGNWEIEGIGEEGIDFYQDQPGFYYFSKNKAAPLVDIIGYDPSQPQKREYGPINSQAFMVERMADDLVPVAILHSASVLKMFVDEARLLPSKFRDSDLAPGGKLAGCNSSTSTTFPTLGLLIGLLFLALRRHRRRSVLKGCKFS